MLKLELFHRSRQNPDGSYDYKSPQLEYDYSHLNEERRDVIVTVYELSGEKKSQSRTYVTFARGLVVGYEDHYLGDGDSTYSVIVWDPVDEKPVSFGLGYSNMARSEHELIEYDAVPEVKAAYSAWKAEQERKAAIEHRNAEIAKQKYAEALEAATPKRGRRVLVVKGRKVPVGTEGVSFWYGQDKFGGFRVGIVKSDGSKVFTAASNVEVVDNLKYLERMSELSEKGVR